MYAGNGYMAYSSFLMQYPTAPVGMIPVELDIEGLYEDHDRRKRKNGNEKVVASHVHSVCKQPAFSKNIADGSSGAERKIELPNGHSETGRRST
jgi:hypothetical protein